jgi:hypothetical protein
MSACAAVARPKVATTALQSLIHFMTQSLLPLGFGFVGRLCRSATCRQKFCSWAVEARTWFGSPGRPATRVACSELPTAVAPLETTKRFFTTQGEPSWAPCLGSGSLPEPHFQAVHEVRPSRSVFEGLEQSIGGIRMTALVAQTSNSQGGYVKPRAGFFGLSACEKWMRP